MLLWILIFMFVMAPAFAVWENRAAEQRGERLADEARAELASGGPVREHKERRLTTWPYVIAALVIPSLWALAGTGAQPTQELEQGALIGAGVFAAIFVWIVFHIFIFVKRMRAGPSLILLALMIATAATLNAAVLTVPLVAEFAQGLS
jgi:hypothetical protein